MVNWRADPRSQGSLSPGLGKALVLPPPISDP